MCHVHIKYLCSLVAWHVAGTSLSLHLACPRCMHHKHSQFARLIMVWELKLWLLQNIPVGSQWCFVWVFNEQNVVLYSLFCPNSCWAFTLLGSCICTYPTHKNHICISQKFQILTPQRTVWDIVALSVHVTSSQHTVSVLYNFESYHSRVHADVFHQLSTTRASPKEFSLCHSIIQCVCCEN